MGSLDMHALIKRIKEEPSVLFLGQNYLSSYSGTDPFYEAVNISLCQGAMPADPSYETRYENIWEYANGGKPLQADTFAQMATVTNQIPMQMWLRCILSMRWGIVYTSAIDACLTHCVGFNFTFNTLGRDKIRFKREYMNKRLLHGIYLYGSVDGCNNELPPSTCDDSTLRHMKKQVNDRISWIYDEILRDYGVLVIDGWDPEKDWLKFLLDNAGSMPFSSIYLFGVTPQMKENETIAGLVEDGILTLYPQSFAQALQEIGYFEEADEIYLGDVSDEEPAKTLTINNKDGKSIYMAIPLSALDALDSHITLLDDDLGVTGRHGDAERNSENLARYLQQGNRPNWTLCAMEPGFHFERAVDDELWENAEKLLKKNISHGQNILILEGVSNSGKTAALTHLALRLRDQHRYPVLYISGGDLTQENYLETLKRFIKRYLFNRQDIDGAWIEKVVIIWDGNADSGAIRNYEKMSRNLAECNALVIGTLYNHENEDPTQIASKRKSGINYIQVNAFLSRTEEQNLGRMLQQTDADLFDRFRQMTAEVKQTARSGRVKPNPNLFYILQRLCNFRYSAEWKSVREALKHRFSLEVVQSEEKTQKTIEQFKYKSEEESVHDAIMAYGAGAAWQLKLKYYLEELKKEGRYDASAESDIDTEEDAQNEEKIHLKEKIQLRDDIRKVNATLALASQFSLSMPVTLLLSMLPNNGGALSKENLFINDILRNDSLIEYERDEQGYPFARFRHPSEAEEYIKINFGEDSNERKNERKKKEVDLLCEIIASCHWQEDEANNVIALVRCFGPNSAGKYSESTSWGHYDKYIDYLRQIADQLREYASDNPEAVLVYAHFLRERYTVDKERGIPGSEGLLRTAASELRLAIENYDQHNNRQYNRLIVELCSNLVASMPRDHSMGKFDRETFKDLQNHFNDAVLHWEEDSRSNIFTTNSLLDIWLNAVVNFHGSFKEPAEALQDEAFTKALSDSLSYIDQLFSTQEDFNSFGLLEKIDKIYKWTSSDDMRKVSEKLAAKGNDTYLYLSARRCWLTEAPVSKTPEGIVSRNLFFLPEDADSREEFRHALPELRTKAIEAAGRAIKILDNEEAWDLIKKSKSSRCIFMLLHSKWLTYTKRLMLEEKQNPALTMDQWRELSTLCELYDQFCVFNAERPNVAANYLRAVYLWSYTPNDSKARDIFKDDVRQRMGRNWFVERIGLCVPGTSQLRTFYVTIERTKSGNFSARIAQEIGTGATAAANERPSLVGRPNIHTSDKMLDYLFDGQLPTQRFCIPKPVVLRFSAAGPVISWPEKKGGDR